MRMTHTGNQGPDFFTLNAKFPFFGLLQLERDREEHLRVQKLFSLHIAFQVGRERTDLGRYTLGTLCLCTG